MDDLARELSGGWDYGTLAPRLAVGEGCRIEGRQVFDRCRGTGTPCVRLGDRVIVYTWTVFNNDPDGVIEVGDDSILVGAIFMCARRIVVGRGVVISYHVTIADSDFHPHDPVERRRDAVANAPMGDRSGRPPIVAQPVVIGDGAWIGIGAFILKGVTIGEGARIGAGSVVTSDVPAFAEVAGNPARVVGPAGGR